MPAYFRGCGLGSPLISRQSCEAEDGFGEKERFAKGVDANIGESVIKCHVLD